MTAPVAPAARPCTLLPTGVMERLRSIVGQVNVLSDPAELAVFETDGFTLARSRPGAVVFCDSADALSQIIRLLADAGVPVVPRGSGTGLTGGCVSFDTAGDHPRPGVIVSVSRMTRILSINLDDRVAHVEAGVRNTQLTEAVARLPGGAAFHFAPDPSSQWASTVGGNAATNAGGIHTLRDFVTSNHVMGVEMVTPAGDLLRLGATDGRHAAPGLPDLAGLVCGSEGTLGIIASLWVRLSPRRPSFRTVVATFGSTVDACAAVSDTIAAGLLPAAMEMLDGRMVQVVEDTFRLGIAPGTQAMLLVELDGPEPTLDDELTEVVAIFKCNGSTTLETASDPARKTQLWAARKKAFGAIGRISPSYCTQDACVPRSKLADVLTVIDEIGRRHGLSINNVFHAGDGNVHPIFLYDDADPRQVRTTIEAAEEVLKACIDLGGTLTGEHGVGVEKLALMPYLFDGRTMQAFAGVKRAFDPQETINPGKLLPSDRVHAEMSAKPGRAVPQ